MSPEERARAIAEPYIGLAKWRRDALAQDIAAAIRAAVAEETERCAKVADSSPHRALLCPFQKANAWGPNITEDDPCPVCKQTGHDDGSKCTATLAGSIAAAIREEPQP